MATASWSTVLDHTTDLGFRNWGSELSSRFAAVGMIQTADTGQINWTTAVRPASTLASAGYEIWKLSSGNLFFKFEYGNSTNTVIPIIFFTVGTGSNGSGTLTGPLATRSGFGAINSGVSSTTTNFQSYLCATPNYLGLSWKIGSTGSAGMPRTAFVAAQTVDSTGSSSSSGFYVGGSESGSVWSSQCLSIASGVVGAQIAANNHPSFFIPNNAVSGPPNSNDGAGNNQAFLWWHNILGVTPLTPLLHVAAILASDLTLGSTASITLVGSTPHSYINAGSNLFLDSRGSVAAANLALLMLFE